MMKKLLFMLLAMAICPIIMVCVVAAAMPQNSIQAKDIQSRNQLLNYVEAVQVSNDSLIDTSSVSPVPATITFAKYVSFDELKEYIAMHNNMEIHQIQLRGLTEDGTRVTVGTLVHKGLEYTEAVVRKQALDQGFELVGITDLYVNIQPGEIHNISEDEITFLVETSANNEVDGTIISPQSPSGESVKNTSVFPKSLTWQLENLNLLK